MVDHNTDRNCFLSAIDLSQWSLGFIHVNQMLHDSSIRHGKRRHPEPKDYPIDRREWDAHLPQKRID